MNTLQLCDSVEPGCQLELRASLSVYLAGGLTPENVASAIRELRPFGLDVCNGLRTNGNLDEEKVRRFFSAIRTVAA